MVGTKYISIGNSYRWKVSLPNPCMMALLFVFASMYASYCLHINIPESIMPIFLIVAIPFFDEKDFLALGACLPLVTGINHLRLLLLFVVVVYFVKYREQFKIDYFYWIAFGFVLLETIDGLQNDYFVWWPFIGWAGKLFFFALCLSLCSKVKPADIVQIMKNYVVIYCCAATILLQRFITEAGSLQAILTGVRRLGDMDIFYGSVSGTDLSNGLSFNPNSLGCLSVLCFGICLLFIYLHYGRRWLWIGIAGFATAIVLMTMSRGAMVAWTAVVLLYFFDLRSLRKNLTIAVVGMVFVCGLGFALYGYSDSFAMMFDNMLARFTMEGDITAGRLNLWEMWNDYFFSQPSVWLTGIGGNNVIERIGAIGIPNCIHGGFQEAYVYWGFIGLFLMFALNWYICKYAKEATGGKLTKLNFLLMLAAWLQLSKGQYMSGGYHIQIIAACAMAYPFWKHQDGSSEYGVRSADRGVKE